MEQKQSLSQDVVQALQELIRVNLDSYKNLAFAYGETSDNTLILLLRKIANQRKEFATELGIHVLANDGDLNPTGRFTEAVHRWWLDITGKLERGGVRVILEEIAQGELSLEKTYGRIMAEAAGTEVSDMLSRQYKAIHESCRRVHELLSEVENESDAKRRS